jgi:hypothetical protein
MLRQCIYVPVILSPSFQRRSLDRALPLRLNTLVRSNRPIVYLLLIAWSVVNGLHWPVWQMAAWSTMLLSYSRDNALTEAVTMTFNGDHPCTMCTAIEKSQNETAKSHGASEGLEQRPPRELTGITGQTIVTPARSFLRGSLLHPEHAMPEPVSYPPPGRPPIPA